MSKLLALVFISTALIASGESLNQNSSESSACGVQDVRYNWRNDISNGQDFEKGSWPWMVALMSLKESPAKIFCAGTLVSMGRVVTGKNLRNINSKAIQRKKFPSPKLHIASKRKTSQRQSNPAKCFKFLVFTI